MIKNRRPHPGERLFFSLSRSEMTKSQPHLTDLLKVLPTGLEQAASEKIRRAYDLASKIFQERRCETGESYLRHNLAVGQILLQLDVDATTIAASLLQNSLRPPLTLTVEELRKQLDAETAALVNDLHALQTYTDNEKYKQLQANAVFTEQSRLESVRRAILAIVKGDIRVILIRMGDCLQTMRQAEALPVERRHEVANEAMHIYAPLSNRLGIWQFKWELEDLAFRYLEPQRYREIASKLAERRAERARKIEVAAAALRRRLKEMNFQAEVTGRTKHIYSIYRKMQRKGVDIDHIYDIQALRVVLQPQEPEKYMMLSGREKDEVDRALCYQVLGLVHSLWQPIPREFDDYIANPKPNGYRSLHTAVIDTKTGQTLEVQIRTVRMHEEAEKGVAAHWAYKEGGTRVSSSAQRQIQSMRELLVAMQEGDWADDSSIIEAESQASHIYVFTPKDDVIELPAGSTPIDFAYQIHTSVGHRCASARVNGKMVSLDYKLQSGDKVEIITNKYPSPRRDWMNASLGYTGSARTRSKIRQWFRQQEREKNVEQGRELVLRELRRLGLQETYSIEDIALALKYDDEEEFLAKVGFGDIQTRQISGAIALMRRELKPEDEDLTPLLAPLQDKPKGLTVRGLSGLHTRMAKCCNPIPPEPIIGYITRGQGVTIHRQNCAQVAAIKERERLIEVDWGVETETYPIPIVVHAYRRAGLIDEMNAILRGQNIGVPKTKRTTDDSTMTVYLVVEVTDLAQLNWLMQKFANLPNVIDVYRQRWS